MKCWDNAGIERNVEPVDAKEIVEHGGSWTAPDEKSATPPADEAGEVEAKPSTKSKGK